jgi:putative transposase
MHNKPNWPCKPLGSARFVYNHYLALRIDAYQQQGITLRYEDCANQLPALKKQHQWLKEVDATALQSALKDLDNAYQHFWKDGFRFPHFKRKHQAKKSFTTKNNCHAIRLEGRFLQLPKLGFVQVAKSREPEGRIPPLRSEHRTFSQGE